MTAVVERSPEPPLAGRRRIAAAVGLFVIAEVVLGATAWTGLAVLLLIDVVLVPAGLVVGLIALARRASRRAAAQKAADLHADPRTGRAEEVDTAVHAALLANLGLFAAAAGLAAALGPELPALWTGTVLFATLCIPVSVGSTLATSSRPRIAAEAALLAGGGAPAGRLRRRRLVVRISLALHVPLAVLTVAALVGWQIAG